MPFVHVHNHTEYSLLDGATRIEAMVDRAVEYDMPAIAITDHGVMFGVMEFYFACKKKGIKPIVGMEAYMAPNGRHVKSGREENQTYHLLLLAKNEVGYRNLCKLHTYAALEGFYYKPRIDHELLREHSAGLIGTSACLGSEVCQALMANEYDKAQHLAGMYKEIFEDGSFFIELQDHGLPEQKAIKEPLLRIARELKLPIIATNDAHYLCRGDAEPHDVILCIGTGSLQSETRRLKFETPEFYLKSPDEMAQTFADLPEGLANTLRIADMCDLELGKQQALMPDPDLPTDITSTDFLRQLAREGLESRLKNPDEAAHQRLEYELSVIEKTGFENYFLLVREFANFTRDQGIMFGVRGSAAGSLVSYSIGITDVDPLEYDLTFERFLNIERIAMPDIDMDFEDARRDEVIQWVTEKYGKDRVAQIVTFGTLGARAAIKDAGRVMGYTPQDTDRICKTIPNLPGMTLQRAIEDSPDFAQLVQNDPKVHSLVETAKSVEGLARHSGVHAAGVVISKDPLMEHIPLYRGNDGQAITAFEMGILEKIGLLKMDFLGLSNLTVLAKTVENIRLDHPDLDPVELLDKMPEDDPKTYEMLGRGETVGVFQLESGGMKRHIIELKPSNVRELAAMVALYRPGPMNHIPDFINSKFGRRQIQFLDEKMRPILEETYGIIVYQDQVLKLVQALAGFSLGKADILRRAMGKKDRDAMAAMKVEFVEGCRDNDVSEAVAEKVWELLLPFAGYAFNKAHAVCYAILAYKTAYLKANYPVAYMAALMACYRDKEDRIVTCIEECRRQKIAVLPPDVNKSLVDFSIEEQAIRFGLVSIKGVGEAIARGIVADRAENGSYSHLYEFCERLKPFGLNRASAEAIIKAGGLDAIEKNRNRLLNAIDFALAAADMMIRAREAGQDSLFGDNSEEVVSTNRPQLPDAASPSRTEILAMEKDVLGIYVSDHPLRGYELALRRAATHPSVAVPELEEGATVTLAGVISGLRTIVTKQRKEKMAQVTLEDFSGQATLIVFPATYAKIGSQLIKDQVVLAKGVVMHRERPGSGGERSIEVRVEEVSPLEAGADPVLTESGADGTVLIRLPKATRSQLESLRDALGKYTGSYNVLLEIGTNGSTQTVHVPLMTHPSNELVATIRSISVEAELELIQNQSFLN